MITTFCTPTRIVAGAGSLATVGALAGELGPGRAALVERLRPRLGGLLILDQPKGLRGRGAGVNALFARRYAECLLRFATEATPRRAS